MTAAEIKPIETIYKGYRMRSRLEARVAIFFEALRIQWEYEPEGFMLDGTPYLPDFWLPTFNGGMYVEVKPTGGDFAKALALCNVTGKSVWLFEGTPAARPYRFILTGPRKVIRPSTGSYGRGWVRRDSGQSELVGVPNFMNAANRMYQIQHCRSFDDPQAFWNDGELNPNYWRSSMNGQDFIHPDCCNSGVGDFDTLVSAVNQARSARFEHGETPVVTTDVYDPFRISYGRQEFLWDDYWWGLPPYNYDPDADA
jgi:hypothetical protein